MIESPASAPPDPRSLRFAGRSMGSSLRLVVAGGTAADGVLAVEAEAAWSAIVEEFEAAEAALSRFRDASELTRLNRSAGTGRPIPATPRLRRALVAADRATRLTDGRFDPRILGDLERLGEHGAPLPSNPAADQPLGDTRPRIGRGRVISLGAAPGSVVADAPIDLGGIGKGLALRWAADRAGRSLRRTLASGGGLLIEAGGDLTSRGRAPGGDRWLVDLEDPRGGSDPPAVIAIEPDGSVATSSILVRRWTAPDGRRVHHLIDPRTGEPGGRGLVSVTVAGRDPAWAEVWSKALFLEGAGGIAAIARRRGLAAWWTSDDGVLEMTPAARPRTAWLATET